MLYYSLHSVFPVFPICFLLSKFHSRSEPSEQAMIRCPPVRWWRPREGQCRLNFWRSVITVVSFVLLLKPCTRISTTLSQLSLIKFQNHTLRRQQRQADNGRFGQIRIDFTASWYDFTCFILVFASHLIHNINCALQGHIPFGLSLRLGSSQPLGKLRRRSLRSVLTHSQHHLLLNAMMIWYCSESRRPCASTCYLIG